MGIALMATHHFDDAALRFDEAAALLPSSAEPRERAKQARRLAAASDPKRPMSGLVEPSVMRVRPEAPSTLAATGLSVDLVTDSSWRRSIGRRSCRALRWRGVWASISPSSNRASISSRGSVIVRSPAARRSVPRHSGTG